MSKVSLRGKKEHSVFLSIEVGGEDLIPGYPTHRNTENQGLESL
jgi:hypothetical protein